VKQLIRADEWAVLQDGFDAADNRVYESLFSLGNGHFGGRGNHEERYSGDSLRGNYLAGIYYPDPTRVGWWKNGYPDYFAKVLNASDWKPVHLTIAGEPLDLATAEIHEYHRELAMRVGELRRGFRATLPNGATVAVETVRFISMARSTVGALRYTLTVLSGPAGSTGGSVEIGIDSHVDGDVVNEDSNYDEGFWDEVSQEATGSRALVVSRTKKTGFVAGTACHTTMRVGEVDVAPEWSGSTRPRFAGCSATVSVGIGEPVELTKVGVNVTSRTMMDGAVGADELVSGVIATCNTDLEAAVGAGFERLRSENADAWEAKWSTSDVAIEGDVPAQQGIRFNIFQLNSTFTGDDPDLNIGPKGFTGEKYGGVTYWDTEAFCLPFYLATAPPAVPRNLLRYRRRQLDRAIENAGKLGFDGGAALYPMVTINGEECHNEWEITFEEIHRNGAIAFAIFDYIRFTGDRGYLLDGGLDVLIAISRFWEQRVSWSEPRQRWVMLGVTGPNEYENNVDDNWYTNLMAQWTLRYTAEAIGLARELDAQRTDAVLAAQGVDEARELSRWRDVADGLHLPEDADRSVFLQQSSYLDKELLTVDDLDPSERPLHRHWSWDRILRSCFIKQADVLQGLWVLGDRFDVDTLRRNFDFYEPRTVHESSLSASVHAVLAVRLGRLAKAHELLLRTARLDLDDYNDDTGDGCHTTSMAGTWIAAVQGFGGLAVRDDRLHLDPTLAPGWTRLAFHVRFRGAVLAVVVDEHAVCVENEGPAECRLVCSGVDLTLPPGTHHRL
jgi:maltose phosphorylase